MTSLCPKPGEVHVRLFNLALNATELTRIERLLTQDELNRADRLIDHQVRNRFIAGRGLLRETLAGCLDRDPSDIVFAANQYGKPFMAGEYSNYGLNFNLSHSGDLAIMALADHYELGIDLEQIRSDLPYEAMAQQFFSRREQADLFSLPAELQQAAFFRCWTRKEAYLKGCGSGFSQPADICDVSLLPDRPPALLADRNDPAQPSRWCLLDLDVPDGFCAALAVQGQSTTIIYFPAA